MQVKRTNRENGAEDLVTLEHAIDKLADLETERADYEYALKAGSVLSTCSYLYEIEKKEISENDR